MKTLQLQNLTITPENQEIVYNSLDTMQTMALKEIFDGGLLPAWASTTYRYSELMLGPIMTMMRRGVQIDTAKRDKLVAGLRVRADKVQANFDYVCEALWGTTINHGAHRCNQGLSENLATKDSTMWHPLGSPHKLGFTQSLDV